MLSGRNGHGRIIPVNLPLQAHRPAACSFLPLSFVHSPLTHPREARLRLLLNVALWLLSRKSIDPSGLVDLSYPSFSSLGKFNVHTSVRCSFDRAPGWRAAAPTWGDENVALFEGESLCPAALGDARRGVVRKREYYQILCSVPPSGGWERWKCSRSVFHPLPLARRLSMLEVRQRRMWGHRIFSAGGRV